MSCGSRGASRVCMRNGHGAEGGGGGGLVIYRRNHGTTGPRDDGTTGRRDHGAHISVNSVSLQTYTHVTEPPPKATAPWTQNA